MPSFEYSSLIVRILSLATIPESRLRSSATGLRTIVALTPLTMMKRVVSIKTNCEVMIANDAVEEEKGPGNVRFRRTESQLRNNCTAEIEEIASSPLRTVKSLLHESLRAFQVQKP